MLGAHLRRMRKNKGLSVREVVMLTGIPRRTIYSYESEEALPIPRKLGLLMHAYGATPGERLDTFDIYIHQEPSGESATSGLDGLRIRRRLGHPPLKTRDASVAT